MRIYSGRSYFLSAGLLLLTILCAIIVLTVHRLRRRNVLIRVVDLMLVLWITAPFLRLAVDMIARVMFVLSPVFVFRLLWGYKLHPYLWPRCTYGRRTKLRRIEVI